MTWFIKAWWKGITRIPTPTNSVGGIVWRAWTTDSCINSVEIPQEASLVNQNVFRTVYDDRKDCVEYFEFLQRSNFSRLEEEVHAGLQDLFKRNNITDPVRVEKANQTLSKLWDSAWYWLRAGSHYSNKDISNWALKPLLGEDVSLVGDGYYIQRSTWSDAAIKSAINLLQHQYNLSYPVSSVSRKLSQQCAASAQKQTLYDRTFFSQRF